MRSSDPVISHGQIIHIRLHCISLTFICAPDMFITGRSCHLISQKAVLTSFNLVSKMRSRTFSPQGCSSPHSRFPFVGPGLALAQVTAVAVVAGVLGTGEVPAAAGAHLAHFLPVTAPPLPLALPSPPPLLYLTNRESESCL